MSGSEFDVEFASSSEIKKVTKGQSAWGTVNREGKILMDNSLSTKMDGTRFTQTLAEEMVHVEQIRSGYYKRIGPSYRRYALESEATGWVISRSDALGLRGRDWEFRQTHRMWTRKWKNEVY